MADVAVVDIDDDIGQAINKVFERTVDGESLIKSSGEVYVKPNGIDFKPFTHTDPLVLEGVIDYFYNKGATQVFVMENSTQANVTRLVFEVTGYKEVCKRTGAKSIYLDEQPTVPVQLEHIKEAVTFPKIVVKKLIEEQEEHTYVNVPKLKTHSMSTVTLGVKNQMAFPVHAYRSRNHDARLHSLLADIYLQVQPDFTLIDGVHAVYNGHYPLESFLSESIDRLDILVGGPDTLAVDTAGAKILGYDVDDVQHLSLLALQGIGNTDYGSIRIDGDMKRFSKRYPHDIIDRMPEDVTIIRGKEKLCREGCDLNVRMLLQLLYYDHEGKGGFTIVMGKGFDEEVINEIEGQVLLAGDCAIQEVRTRLEEKLGEKNVYLSPACNSLASTTTALCKLMGVSPLELVPSKFQAIKAFVLAKIHGSTALTPDLF